MVRVMVGLWLVLVLSVGVACAAGNNLNVLTSVHGYVVGGRVMLPVAGTVRWLGGTTTYARPTITIQLGQMRIVLREGSTTCVRNGQQGRMAQATTVYAGTACLPARVLAELLGFQVAYLDGSQEGNGSPSETEQMGGNPFLRLTAGSRVARVLVHEEPPSVVAKVVADLQNTMQHDRADPSISFRLGQYGTDWILRVKRIHSGFFASSVPAQADDEMYPGQVIFFANAVGVYGLKQGKWRFLIGMQDSPSYRAWDAAGIPRAVAPALGIRLRNY